MQFSQLNEMGAQATVYHMTDCAEHADWASVPIPVIAAIELGRTAGAPHVGLDVAASRGVPVVAPPMSGDLDVRMSEGSGGIGSSSVVQESFSGLKVGSGAEKVEKAASPSSTTKNGSAIASKEEGGGEHIQVTRVSL